MGITSSLKKLEDYEIRELNSFLENNIPDRNAFKSNIGIKNFDTQYPILVSRRPNSASPTLIGILSEFYIDVVVGRYVDSPCGAVREMADLVLSELAGKAIIFSSYKDSVNRIISCLDNIKGYVTGENISEDVVIDAIYTVYKHGHVPFSDIVIQRKESNDDIYNHIFEDKLNDDTMVEIKQMGRIFLEKFVTAGLLKKDSVVIINPRFGDWSETLGAIGDLYIDGTIYDIKSRSKEGYRKDEIEQIYAYYLCSILDKNYGATFQGNKVVKKQSNMENKAVSGIGIYLSRFGEIVNCDIEKAGYTLEPEELEPIARIIAGSKQDRINKYLAMQGPGQRSAPVAAFDVLKKQRFKNISLDENIFKERSLSEYMSYAFPAKVESKYDIAELEPVMWTGNMIPSVVKEKNLFYVVHFKASFEIKRGEMPFVRARRSFLFKNTVNMETSDFFNNADGKFYSHYRDINNEIVESMAEITMTKEDYEHFQAIYNVKNIIIFDGCYFV